jgi:hypothetical protein
MKENFMDEWARIEEFYSKPGRFLCTSGDKETEVEVVHIVDKGVTPAKVKKGERLLGRRLPKSHIDFLKRLNGAIFFTQVRPGGCYSGFMIYPCELIAENHHDRISDLENWVKDVEDGDEECSKWLKNIIVIGEELRSGNYLILDLSKADDPERPPVAFLDHELPFSCASPDSREGIIADTPEGVLLRASENPARFLTSVLGAVTRYYDGKGGDEDGDWYPVAFRLTTDDEFIYGDDEA